ncbi:hypothetical protein ABIA32_002687 [Streptacidiphilus sp. MAP12-20]
MREYPWSWDQYLATPPYVRRVCWDLMIARREAQDAAQQRANGGS